MGICFEVVEFFGGTHPEGEFCQSSDTVLVTVLYHKSFSGGAVDLAIGDGACADR